MYQSEGVVTKRLRSLRRNGLAERVQTKREEVENVVDNLTEVHAVELQVFILKSEENTCGTKYIKVRRERTETEG